MISKEAKRKVFEYILLLRQEKLKEQIIEEILSKIPNLNKEESQFTSKQICTIYKISTSTLERYVRNGLKFRNTGKNTKRLFTKDEFENYLKKQNYGRHY
jgi:hypothetical protein